MKVPSRRRCSLRVRTITALTAVPFLAVPSGDASLTAAVTMSPNPATRPVEPPSGRIICSLRAPELSATSSMLLIITAIVVSPCCSSGLARQLLLDWRHLRRAAHNFLQLPALQLRQRTRLFNLHKITEMRRAVLVVCIKLFAARHHALVERVRLLAPHFDHDGLGHLGGNHFTDQDLAAACAGFFAGCRRFRHDLLFLRRGLLTGRLLRFHWRAGRRRPCHWRLGCGRSVAAGQLFLAHHGLYARNVLLQLADLLQALGLSHLQLKLHLEELIRELALLMEQFGIG